MKILLYILGGIAALLVLLVIISLFLPSTVHVERSESIAAEPPVVFEQVNTLRNWEAWSPWHGIDPEMRLYYEGPPSGEGAGYRWESDHGSVGNGSLTITRSEPYSRIETALDFMEQGTATGTYVFEPVEGGTRVTWSMDTDMGNNPIAKYFGLMMDRMIGSDFEEGLQNLKRVSESAQQAEPQPAPAEADTLVTQSLRYDG